MDKGKAFKSPASLCALTGVLLFLLYPEFNLSFLAWFALVPLLIVLQEAKSMGAALRAGAIAGAVFFMVTLHWLVNVATFGWIFMVLLETAYFLVFTWLVYEGRGIRRTFLRMLWVASAWTTMEIIRTEFPVFGMGWNQLAYSQAGDPLVAQAANTVGSYGVGFVIAFVNACLAGIAADYRKESRREILKISSLLFAVLALLGSHGLYHLKKDAKATGELRIAVVQGNIPQHIKWEAMARDKILEIYTKLTELASFENPDLVIWPEAAFPGYFNRDLAADRVIETVQKTGVPLVVGSPHLEDDRKTAFNSAYLLDAAGKVADRYDKRYLVPFGEYVPLKPFLGFLEPLAYTLGVSDFAAGHAPKIFTIQNGEIPFSVLICFEDIFPNLARQAAKGASFLAVITNDAWFGQTGAAHQHMQASVFRAIENGLPVVRAANTGVSGFISAKGKVLGTVRDAKGREIFSTGQKTLPVPLEHIDTLYRRGGWVLPYFAPLASVIMLAGKFRKKREAAGAGSMS